ncbi:hypothetical protein [Microcoleus asticus]|nr:hypothetical protein [Microcoleus asticus]
MALNRHRSIGEKFSLELYMSASPAKMPDRPIGRFSSGCAKIV